MATPRLRPRAPARRDLLRTGLYGVGLGAVGVPALFSRKVALGAEPAARRILVVVELSGANDGLNTVCLHR
jgi:uncharacterized protein (DUF1501 family)